MNRLLSLFVALLGITAPLSAAERPGASNGPPKGTIVFSSLAPRGWDIYLRDVDGGASRLTRHPALDFNAAFSPDGQRIAFVSECDGNMELYTMNSDGSGRQRLTSDFALDDHPTWSPDGRQIAFVSTRQPAPAGRAWNAIFAMDSDGSNVRRLSSADMVDYSPAWSPRGDLIAFASGSGRSGQSDIYVMKPNGQRRRLVVENGGWPAFVDEGRAIAFHRQRDGDGWDVWRINTDESELKRLVENASMPRATADGSKIALVVHSGSDQQIAVFDVERGTLEEITVDQTDHWNPTISPDGMTIVYHKRTPGQTTPNTEAWGRPPDTRLNLVRLAGAFPAFAPDEKRLALTDLSFAAIDVMNVDGSGRNTIYRGERRTLFGVSWSRHLERVAFSHGVVFGDAGANVNIMAASPDGEDLVELTKGAGNNGFPSYSPDGEQLVFRSGRDGAKNLYIMDHFGKHVRRLTQGDWTDTMCDWSPTGKWITFASNRDGDFDVWLIRPDGSGLRKLIGGGGRHNHPHFSPHEQWIVFTSQRAGLSAEEISLPHQPQPYGDLFVIRADGTGLLRLTHNGFEEGTPAWAQVAKIKPPNEGTLNGQDY